MKTISAYKSTLQRETQKTGVMTYTGYSGICPLNGGT